MKHSSETKAIAIMYLPLPEEFVEPHDLLAGPCEAWQPNCVHTGGTDRPGRASWVQPPRHRQAETETPVSPPQVFIRKGQHGTTGYLLRGICSAMSYGCNLLLLFYATVYFREHMRCRGRP